MTVDYIHLFTLGPDTRAHDGVIDIAAEEEDRVTLYFFPIKVYA